MSLKVGLVGAGLMMQVVHLPHLKQIEGIEIVAIADLNMELAEKTARAFGIPRYYDSSENLVKMEEDIDAVVVVTRKDFHASAALPALERGIHVFVEKPLEVSITLAEQMVETANKSSAKLMVGYMKRYDPAVLKLENLLKSNEIGDVFQANIHNFGGDWIQGAHGIGQLLPNFDEVNNPYEFQYERQYDKPQMGTYKKESWESIYDEWIEVWSHDVNLARTFFGEAEEMLYVQNENPRLALVRFEKARVLFEVGQCNYIQGAWDENITIHGKIGKATLKFPAPLLFRQPTNLTIEKPNNIYKPVLPNGEAFQRELVHFFRCIVNDNQPLTNGDEALKDLKLCKALAQSQGVLQG